MCLLGLQMRIKYHLLPLAQQAAQPEESPAVTKLHTCCQS